MAQLIGWPGQRGFTTITLAHITFSLAYVATIVRSRLVSMDVSRRGSGDGPRLAPVEGAAHITLPIIAPAIVAGWLLAFTLSLDDVVITSFTTGPGATTLPILIWSKVQLGVTPDINALATMIVVVVGIGVAIAGVILHRLEKRRERDIQAAIAANTA